jgi:outer membrane protein
MFHPATNLMKSPRLVTNPGLIIFESNLSCIMNKYYFFLSLVFTALTASLAAQRVGFVDSKVILSKSTEFQTAEREMDQMRDQWQKEIAEKRKKIEQMQMDYRAEEVLLPEDMKAQRLETIKMEEQALADFQQKKFGYEGEHFKARKDKIKPIQEKLFEAIQVVAKEKKIDIVIDKASNASLLYANPAYDLSNAVLEKMGSGNAPTPAPKK